MDLRAADGGSGGDRNRPAGKAASPARQLRRRGGAGGQLNRRVQAAILLRGIRQSPSKVAPSFSTRLGVLMVHCARAVASNSTRSRAVTSPLKTPAMVTRVAEIRALTTAPLAITTSSPLISPSASPSIFTGPRKFNLPEILEPLPILDSVASSGAAIGLCFLSM